MAGHWAMATFTLVSLGSWCAPHTSHIQGRQLNISLRRHICQKRFADERKQVARVVESIPKRTLKQSNDNAPTSPENEKTS